MGILDFLKRKPEPTASVARERLRIIVAQERSTRGAPDYLPLMRNELLEVIKKYVHVELEDININVERGADHEILELSVTLGGAEPVDDHAGKPRKSGKKSKGR
jgi:cell division topological specificity factor